MAVFAFSLSFLVFLVFLLVINLICLIVLILVVLIASVALVILAVLAVFSGLLLTIVLIAWIVARLAAVDIPIPVSAAMTGAVLAFLIFAFALIKNLADDYSTFWSYIGVALAALIAGGLMTDSVAGLLRVVIITDAVLLVVLLATSWLRLRTPAPERQ